MSKLEISSHQGAYPVEAVSSLEALVTELLAIPNVMVAIDEKVAGLYAQPFEKLFSQRTVVHLIASEEEKSLDGVKKLATALQKNNATKQTTLIAIGGGIIQDICALTAHLYYRGIPWVFVPTTLLSMADSCIGAKCGINLNEFKNQLGSFQSPNKVLIQTDFLKTLTDQDMASGYGEILKLAVTGSLTLYQELKAAVEAEGLRNSKLSDLIFKSLEVKKAIIEEDEYEKNLRKILNYGHTFGHALESVTSHEIPHGLAVAWGMDLINFMSLKRGLISEQNYQEIHAFIQKYLPFNLSQKVSAQSLIQISKRDKKAAQTHLNLVVMEDFGKLTLQKTPFNAELETVLQEYVDQQNVFA